MSTGGTEDESRSRRGRLDTVDDPPDDAMPGPADASSPKPRRRMRRGVKITLWVVLSLVAVLLVLGALGALVAVKALAAKDALEGAQGTVTTLQAQAAAFDVAGLQASARTLEEQTDAAVAATSDPLYRFAEGVPALGPNLVATRQISESVQLVSRDAVTPLAGLASGLTLASLAPVDGRIDLWPIAEGRAALAGADAAVNAANAQVSAIDTTGTIAPIAEAKSALVDALPNALDTTSKLRDLLDTAWGILGGNGPRNYLLVSPNNAEITALGGGTASMSLLSVDQGAIAITDQADSTDFPYSDNPVLRLDGNVEGLFPYITETMNWATSRPDFLTAAKIIEAFWARDRGSPPIDGIVSVDPIALGYLLEATGPVTLADGTVLDSANAVPTLLHDVYTRYSDDVVKAETDTFFASATRSIFDTLTDFSGDPQALLTAVDRGIQNGSVMAWMNDPAAQKLIDGTRLAGTLPTSNAQSTVTGVFFRDVTSSKTDYYLETSVAQSSDACTNPSSPVFTTTVRLHSTLTEEEADSLSRFIAGSHRGAYFSTEVYVYGPVGASITSAGVVQKSINTHYMQPANDLGRPVAKFIVDLQPGEEAVIEASFQGASGTYGPVAVRTSPMIHPTAVDLTGAVCK